MSKDKELKSKIGGQALIEGIMMLGVYKGAMACRLPDGTIDVETWDEKGGKNAPFYKKIPIIRGFFNFISSMLKGYKYLMKSADKQFVDEDEDKIKDDKASDKIIDTGNITNEFKTQETALEEKNQTTGENILLSIFMVIGCIVGVGVALGLFLFLPKWLVSVIPVLAENRILRSLSEGIIKIILFVSYMAVTSLMKDVRRTYEYHGAEHKTIACHEARLPLTVENIKKQTRFHKRCGTSFIFIVLIVGILAMCFVPFTVVWKRVVTNLILLPLVVGISYECIRLAGNHDNVFTRFLSAPGLALQRITTREPDEKQIEVAIAALKPCIPENIEEDIW